MRNSNLATTFNGTASSTANGTASCTANGTASCTANGTGSSATNGTASSTVFCVPTILAEHNCAAAPDVKVLGLDIGYSGVKAFSDRIHACFPSLARKIETVDFIGESNANDILYRDEGGMWVVGATALREIGLSDTNDSETTLFARQRYSSEMFKVIARVGMGLLLMGERGISDGANRQVFLQTGLPPAYIRSDRQALTESLAGIHEFEIKFGRKGWKRFFFELPESHIDVMSQPLGALFSTVLTDDCIQLHKAKEIFYSGTLCFDPGFGTVDTALIQNGTIKDSQSFDNFGMKMVYKRLSELIEQAYGTFVPTHAIQKVLLDGGVWCFDKKSRGSVFNPVAGLLEQCNEETCGYTLEKLVTTYDYLQGCRYLLVTGGTGEAWRSFITSFFAGMQHLQILYGNQNSPELPQTFSNVRGYYLRRVGMMRAKK